MMDLAFMALTLTLFAVTWGFVRLCDRQRD